MEYVITIVFVLILALIIKVIVMLRREHLDRCKRHDHWSKALHYVLCTLHVSRFYIENKDKMSVETLNSYGDLFDFLDKSLKDTYFNTDKEI